jgi:hypothetical protein
MSFVVRWHTVVTFFAVVMTVLSHRVAWPWDFALALSGCGKFLLVLLLTTCAVCWHRTENSRKNDDRKTWEIRRGILRLLFRDVSFSSVALFGDKAIDEMIAHEYRASIASLLYSVIAVCMSYLFLVYSQKRFEYPKDDANEDDFF